MIFTDKGIDRQPAEFYSGDPETTTVQPGQVGSLAAKRNQTVISRAQGQRIKKLLQKVMWFVFMKTDFAGFPASEPELFIHSLCLAVTTGRG